ncbi:MAG TPA: tetratricopeptide repeat protein [Flavobacteriales bacterium]|nr:tetratricopeptide repeat protein [Flavobacteriales bacterium]HIO68054.1 tetratricopeptide repeat protein [Flavobacteriales bacterium]
MAMKSLLTLFTVLTVSLSSWSQQAELDKGMGYYNKRAEGAIELVAKAGNIDKAIGHFRTAVSNEATKKDAAVMLMKCYYYKGTFVETEKDKRLAVYNLSKALGEKMMAVYPRSAPIVYWHATNMGKWGETSGILKAAKEGLADLMKEWCEKVIELDASYKDGAGDRMLGIVHFKTPYIPFILSWPDNDDALLHLEKALEYNDKDFIANVYYAQALKSDGEKEKAIAILEKVVTWKPAPSQLLEDKKELKEAKRLLKAYK